jgi:hypothetical protein
MRRTAGNKGAIIKSRTILSIPNSVLLVMDQSAGVIPETIDGVIANTPTCIAVGTACECDEQVDIELTDEPPEVDERMQCVSRSSIATPNREIAVCSAHNDRLLSIKVQHDVSEVDVWVNHPTEPDRIIVAVRSASHT